MKTLLALLLLIPSLSWSSDINSFTPNDKLGELKKLINPDNIQAPELISVIGKSLICFRDDNGSVIGFNFLDGFYVEDESISNSEDKEMGWVEFAYINEYDDDLANFYLLYYNAFFDYVVFQIPTDIGDETMLTFSNNIMGLDRDDGSLLLHDSKFVSFLDITNGEMLFFCEETETNNIYSEVLIKHYELIRNLEENRKF